MFQLRKNQMNAFSAERLERFVTRMVNRLPADFPTDVRRLRLTPEAIEPLVRDGIRRAGEFGVRIERDVELFLECLLMFHPHFDDDDREAWAGEILRDENLTGTQKMDRIHDHLVFQTSKGRKEKEVDEQVERDSQVESEAAS